MSSQRRHKRRARFVAQPRLAQKAYRNATCPIEICNTIKRLVIHVRDDTHAHTKRRYRPRRQVLLLCVVRVPVVCALGHTAKHNLRHCVRADRPHWGAPAYARQRRNGERQRRRWGFSAVAQRTRERIKQRARRCPARCSSIASACRARQLKSAHARASDSVPAYWREYDDDDDDRFAFDMLPNYQRIRNSVECATRTTSVAWVCGQ